jgi:hypothetical protein
MQRVARREEGARGRQVRVVLALRCKIAHVSVVLPPLCAHIGARRGSRSGFKPKLCAYCGAHAADERPIRTACST